MNVRIVHLIRMKLKHIKMMDYLWAQGAEVFSFDPIADDDHAEGGRGAVILDHLDENQTYDAVIVTLCHSVFRQHIDLPMLEQMTVRHAPLIDMRGMYDQPDVHDHFVYWRP